MLFEHQAPLLDYVEQCLAERTNIDAEPLLKYNSSFNDFDLVVNCLVRIDLKWTKSSDKWMNEIYEKQQKVGLSLQPIQKKWKQIVILRGNQPVNINKNGYINDFIEVETIVCNKNDGVLYF